MWISANVKLFCIERIKHIFLSIEYAQMEKGRSEQVTSPHFREFSAGCQPRRPVKASFWCGNHIVLRMDHSLYCPLPAATPIESV